MLCMITVIYTVFLLLNPGYMMVLLMVYSTPSRSILFYDVIVLNTEAGESVFLLRVSISLGYSSQRNTGRPV